ncbi:MAG: Acid phosphatase [Actinomycetia bacterium]|nr:Acid phosphatase [Actinomycetes bacterium]
MGQRRIAVGIAALVLATTMTTAVGAAATGGGSPLGARQRTGIRKINHVVVMMQENRSFDSYYSQLHFEGQPNVGAEPNKPNPNPLDPNAPGISPFHQTQLCSVADLNHSWNGTHAEWNGGRMDGFTAANTTSSDPTGSRTMGYYDQQQLPYYYALANTFGIGDRYFSSVLSQTFPNRFYLAAGTSFGHIRNDLAVFPQKTVFREMDEANPPISWKLYVSSFSVFQLFEDVQQHASNVVPISQYYTDAANGKLPQVAFVESSPFGSVNQETDEHPPANIQVGEKFTHDVIAALMQSPNWRSSAMFLTYDEHGGFYDHVRPPRAPVPDNIGPILVPGDTPARFDRYGIRVPAIVISPFAKAHYVSHVVYDHTSILRFIEARYGLPAMTKRDAAASPMLDFFNFSHPTFRQPPFLPDAPIDPAGAAACSALHP